MPEITNERIAEIKSVCNECVNDNFHYSDILAIISRLDRAEADKTALEAERDAMKAVVDRLTCEVNGYDQKKMLEDIKPLAINHGGYQNAYTISNLIETIEAANLIAAKSGGA